MVVRSTDTSKGDFMMDQKVSWKISCSTLNVVPPIVNWGVEKWDEVLWVKDILLMCASRAV